MCPVKKPGIICPSEVEPGQYVRDIIYQVKSGIICPVKKSGLICPVKKFGLICPVKKFGLICPVMFQYGILVITPFVLQLCIM